MISDIKSAFKNMLCRKALLSSIAMALSLSVLSYSIKGIIVYSFALFFLIIIFDFAMHLFEFKQGLKRKPLWQAQEVPKKFLARILQTLLLTTFWGVCMYLMVWSDNLIGLLIGVPIFGVVMFVFLECSARSQKTI